VDGRRDPHGGRAHLAFGQEKLHAEQDRANPEQAECVLDSLRLARPYPKLPREDGGREKRDRNVRDPNPRQT
jgi:hypothetical protein